MIQRLVDSDYAFREEAFAALVVLARKHSGGAALLGNQGDEQQSVVNTANLEFSSWGQTFGDEQIVRPNASEILFTIMGNPS